MSKHALYRFYGDTGQLLYVGITQDPGKRFAQHASTKSWWTSVHGISIEWYSSRRDVEDAEKRAIKVERPLANVVRSPIRDRARKCGHCIGCLTGEPCFVLEPTEETAIPSCRACGEPGCLFEIGFDAGDQAGWSRAHDFYRTKWGGA